MGIGNQHFSAQQPLGDPSQQLVAQLIAQGFDRNGIISGHRLFHG